MATDVSFVDGISDYVSDDSSFYGDEQANERLQEVSEQSWSAFAGSYPKVHARMPYVLGYNPRDTKRLTEPDTKELWNPYNHLVNAKQLGESVEEFLNRLTPSRSSTSDGWIWVAKPVFKQRNKQEDLAGFTRAATKALDANKSLRDHVSNNGQPRTKKAKVERDKLQQELQRLAKEYKVLTGKWMLFPDAADVDRYWSSVVRAVLSGRLGIAAKVASADASPEKSGKLICIYTEDFSDIADVRRVLEAIFDLDLARRGSSRDNRGIYYKADAYTHLGIESKNEWGIRASLYSSIEPPSAAKAISKEEDWNF